MRVIEVKTTRCFRIRPKGMLVGRLPNCRHTDRYGWMYRRVVCPCLRYLGSNEQVGVEAIFETDQVSFSNLKAVHLAAGNGETMRVDSSEFEVLEELQSGAVLMVVR